MLGHTLLTAFNHSRRLTVAAKPWEQPPAGPFTLYHLSDSKGRLLYIGQSSRPEARILQHKANVAAGWTCEISSWEFFGPFETRAEARAAEARAIVLLSPPWNSVHDGGGKIPCSVSDVVREIQCRMEACTLHMRDAIREVMSITGDTPGRAAKRINLRRPERGGKGSQSVEALVAYNMAQAVYAPSLYDYFNPRPRPKSPETLQRLRNLGLLKEPEFTR